MHAPDLLPITLCHIRNAYPFISIIDLAHGQAVLGRFPNKRISMKYNGISSTSFMDLFLQITIRPLHSEKSHNQSR